MNQETIDRYGRAVGHVYLDGRDINREMVREMALLGSFAGVLVTDHYAGYNWKPSLNAAAKPGRSANGCYC